MSEKIQKATEKIQDYYDKSFAIQNSIGCTKKRKDILDFIHEIRKTDKFPNDGGYSGAIILEKMK